MGRLFRRSTIRRTSSFRTSRKSIPLGKYSRMSPFVFSFVPRSQGLCEWAKYTGSPGQQILPCVAQTPFRCPSSGCGTPAHQADGSGQPEQLQQSCPVSPRRGQQASPSVNHGNQTPCPRLAQNGIHLPVSDVKPLFNEAQWEQCP